MDLKLELPSNLYEDLRKHKALSIIEEITNDKNFISVDLYDIEAFKDKSIIERIDYKNNESIPKVDIYPQSIIACLTIPLTTTLSEINIEVEKIMKTFNTKDIVFGTTTDKNIKDKTIGITCLLFRNLEWNKINI